MRIFSKIFVFALAVGLSFSSCKKETPSYSFTVKVVTEEGVALPNVFVEASADVPNAIPELNDLYGNTNDDGEINFSYSYEAVLKVRATRSSNPPTWMGCNFVKLEADKNVIVTIVLQPYDPSQPGC